VVAKTYITDLEERLAREISEKVEVPRDESDMPSSIASDITAILKLEGWLCIEDPCGGIITCEQVGQDYHVQCHQGRRPKDHLYEGPDLEAALKVMLAHAHEPWGKPPLSEQPQPHAGES